MLTSYTVAIALALVAAVCLAVGTHAQHRAIASTGGSALRQAARSPLRLMGLGLLVLETVLNVLALGLAPVALIQPLGTLFLVAVVLLGVREGRAHQLTRRVVAGIALTVVSVALFVGLSSPWSTPPEAAPTQILHLAFLLVSFSVLGCAVAVSPLGHLVRIVCTGVVFGSVAAGAHVLVHEVRAGAFSTVHGVLLVALVVGSVAGMWVVQTAYRSGPPETVLAGLTVIDPLVAVGIGALLLGEYEGLPAAVLCALVVAAAAATAGICLLVRAHPAARAHPAVRSAPAVSHRSRASASTEPSAPSSPSTPMTPSAHITHATAALHGAILTNRRS